MPSIKHVFHINAPREKVFEALSTMDGVSNWWTTQASGESIVGGVITFRFGEQWMNQMKVVALEPPSLVKWECVAGADDWIGNILSFELEDKDGKTMVRFEHAGWKEANDFYGMCSFSWGRYMESLRQLCQTGKGEAFGSEGYKS